MTRIAAAHPTVHDYVTWACARHLRVGGLVMSGNLFVGVRIGVWVKSTGGVAIGVP